MRIAVISDIHGNLEALSSVIFDTRSRKVDKIVCLGDVIGYGASPNECVEMVRAECDFCLIGNHEAAVFDNVVLQEFNEYAKIAINWTRENLTSKASDFINSLSMSQIFDCFTAVHSTPYEPHLWYYISSLEDALFNFNFFNTRFCLIGHTHVPGIIAMEEDGSVSVLQPKTFNYGAAFSERAKFIINVGSVGQPRDKNPKSCYVIIDTNEKELSFLRVSYDIAQYKRKMRIAGMPEFLISRVIDGN